MSWYDDDELWKAFQETLFSEARAEDAKEIVADSPLLHFAPGSRVLDQCCGLGLFTVPLARRGYRVSGVDLSKPLLDLAGTAVEDAGLDVDLHHADVLEFTRPGEYDVVLNLYTSFGYFDDDADNQKVLQNAFDSLAPGGQLLVDVLGKEVFAGWVGPPKTVPVPGGFVLMQDTILDDWSRFRTDWTLVRGGTAKQASICCYVYSAVELRGMFERAGFTDVQCFGGFDGEPYDNRASRLIVRGTRAA